VVGLPLVRKRVFWEWTQLWREPWTPCWDIRACRRRPDTSGSSCCVSRTTDVKPATKLYSQNLKKRTQFKTLSYTLKPTFYLARQNTARHAFWHRKKSRRVVAGEVKFGLYWQTSSANKKANLACEKLWLLCCSIIYLRHCVSVYRTFGEINSVAIDVLNINPDTLSNQITVVYVSFRRL